MDALLQKEYKFPNKVLLIEQDEDGQCAIQAYIIFFIDCLHLVEKISVQGKSPLLQSGHRIQNSKCSFFSQKYWSF